MRKKSLTYYLKTIRLKALALRLRLRADTTDQLQLRAQLKSTHLKALEKLDPQQINLDQAGLYYTTYRHFAHPKYLASSLLFNEDGIAYSSVNNPHSAFINPLFPAYYGLVCFNHFQEQGDLESQQAFLSQAEFLMKHGQWEGDAFLLRYAFDYPAFELKAPWVAGITQALAASLFYRAHLQNPSRGFDNYLAGVMRTMFIPSEEGGLLSKTEQGNPWIEEYPSKPPSLVLNGFIFCIIATIEYAAFSQETYYQQQAEALLRSLVTELHHYKYGKYLRHNLRHWDLSNLEYQGLYVFQFTHLYKLTGLELFKELAVELEQAFKWKDFFYFYQMPIRDINLPNYLKSTKA